MGNLKRHVRRNHPEEFVKIEKEEAAAKDAIALAAKKPKAYILLKKTYIHTYIYMNYLLFTCFYTDDGMKYALDFVTFLNYIIKEKVL